MSGITFHFTFIVLLTPFYCVETNTKIYDNSVLWIRCWEPACSICRFVISHFFFLSRRLWPKWSGMNNGVDRNCRTDKLTLLIRFNLQIFSSLSHCHPLLAFFTKSPGSLCPMHLISKLGWLYSNYFYCLPYISIQPDLSL